MESANTRPKTGETGLTFLAGGLRSFFLIYPASRAVLNTNVS